jgi:hypothetical protein
LADDAGALLVRSGLVAAGDLAAARGVCAQVGGTLGEHLVAAGLISDEALTEFYRSRLLVPQVNPNSLARLSKDVVAAVPPDMAVEFRVVPVSIDREGNLTVAMSDPSNRHAVDEIAFFTGKYVVRAVATQMQIAWCLAHYYGHITELGTRLLRPAAEPAPAPAPAPPPAPAPAPLAGPPAIPRARGDTGRVEASRHRALAPITRPPLDEARPSPDWLDPAKRAPVAPPAAAAPPPVPPTKAVATPPPAPVATPAPAPLVPKIAPDATTLVPGQISASDVARAAAERAEAPKPAAATSAAPTLVEPEPSGEVIEITDYPSGPVTQPEITQPTGRVGRGQQQPNPPELASRAGEILMRDPSAGSKVEEPAVVIAVDRLEPSAPVVIVEAEGERSAPAPLDDADEPTGPTLDLLERAPDDGEEITDEEPAIVHDRGAEPDSAPILLDRKRTLPPVFAPTAGDRADTEPGDRGDDAATPTVQTAAAPGDDADSDVVLLSQPKARPRRTEKRTQLGIGAIGAMTPRPAVATDDATSPGVQVVLTAPPEIPSEGDRTIKVPFDYAPEATEPERSGDRVVAGAPSMTSDPVADGVPRAFVDDDDDRKTRPVEAVRPPRSSRSAEVDDGWGPPGTTIPPPFIGATQGIDDTNPSVKIPLSTVDDESGPLVVKPATGPLADAAAAAAERAAGAKGPVPAPPKLPSPTAAPKKPASAAPQKPIASPVSNRTMATAIPPMPAPAAPGAPKPAPAAPGAPKPAPARPPSGPASTLLQAPPRPPTSPATGAAGARPKASPADLAHDLEEAATKLLELLRELEKAQQRDAVIELLVGHLARSHARVGFFAVKGGELQPLALRPMPPGPLPTLLLSRASTFQDVVGTRLPYRGPVVDDATRKLLVAAFASAPDEMLALPVAIKDRVVGIAYGDSRQRHTFDEQLAIAARAAGQALERILKEHKRAV